MSAKLTRQQIARRLQAEVGSLAEARRFVDVFFDVLGNTVADSGRLKIHGFGVFRCVDKKERIGRNPRTGQAATITARRVVNFTASKIFKQRVSEYDGD